MSDRIPTIGMHRGIPLHDFQSDDRLDRVRAEIDAVYELQDLEALYEFAISFRNAPEPRLFAKARILAAFEGRAGAHESRGDIDVDRLNAATTALDSLTWTDPNYYVAIGTPEWRAPGVRQTMGQRPPHQARRLLEAREAARPARRASAEAPAG